jgi:hypothetical protein
LQGSRAFFDGIENLAAKGRNPFRHYTQALLSENDWAEIAGVTDASRERENILFDRVCGAMPEGINPNALSTKH